MKIVNLNQDAIQLINADCLNYLKNIADNSVDLVLTDPPYFRVKKKEAWDNQWSDKDAYLAWLDEVLLELQRVLKPNGSFFIFCASKLSAATELLVGQRFNVLNHIVWDKNSGPWNKTRKEDLRSFRPKTERIIFAEHYGSETFAKGTSGYKHKCIDLRQQLFSPLIEYFKVAKEKLGVSAKDINQATGKQMSSHWFSYSQWQLPNESDYLKLQALFNKKSESLIKEYSGLEKEYSVLQKEYEPLVKQYSELKEQYRSFRRTFKVTKDVPFTDVWTYKKVEFYDGKHPCEKPAAMLEDMIKATTNAGDLVLDCFMGSGSTGKACHRLERRFIGIELEKIRFNKTLTEIDNLLASDLLIAN